MDWGAYQATVHRVAKSQTQLSDFTLGRWHKLFRCPVGFWISHLIPSTVYLFCKYIVNVNISCSHLPRCFLAFLWCLQFPHLFSALLPEPCACLFLLHFYDVSAIAISFALLALSNNRMSGWLADIIGLVFMAPSQNTFCDYFLTCS